MLSKKSCHHQYAINLGIFWATKDSFTISFIARETINAAFKEAFKMEKPSSRHCDEVAFGKQPSKDATPQLGKLVSGMLMPGKKNINHVVWVGAK